MLCPAINRASLFSSEEYRSMLFQSRWRNHDRSNRRNREALGSSCPSRTLCHRHAEGRFPYVLYDRHRRRRAYNRCYPHGRHRCKSVGEIQFDQRRSRRSELRNSDIQRTFSVGRQWRRTDLERYHDICDCSPKLGAIRVQAAEWRRILSALRHPDLRRLLSHCRRARRPQQRRHDPPMPGWRAIGRCSTS